MAGAFTTVNLSQLPPPAIVEQLDFETILAAILADFQARMDATGEPFTALVESDPAYKIAEAAAYREVLLRQRVNEACLAVMIAFAMGADLDQIGANFNVARLLIEAGDPDAIPPTPDVYETDDDFRLRIPLSLEGYTTAGSEGSYVFHGMSASGSVKDVSAVSPTPGYVTVYVLSRDGDGEADAALIETVSDALNAENVRPMTDNVTVMSASIVPYTITAELVLYPGPAADVVLASALAAIQKYTNDMHRIGYDVSLSGIYQALHLPGMVQRVNLAAPAADLAISDGQAAYCTGITMTVAASTNV